MVVCGRILKRLGNRWHFNQETMKKTNAQSLSPVNFTTKTLSREGHEVFEYKSLTLRAPRALESSWFWMTGPFIFVHHIIISKKMTKRRLVLLCLPNSSSKNWFRVMFQLLQMLFEEFKNSGIFIIPWVCACKPMRFSRVDHHFELFVSALNQLFGILKGILGADVIIHKTVK